MKSRLTPFAVFTTRKGPKGSGAARPRISARNAADSRLSLAYTMVWLSSMLMPNRPISPKSESVLNPAGVAGLEVAVPRQGPQRKDFRVAVEAQIEHKRESAAGVVQTLPQSI